MTTPWRADTCPVCGEVHRDIPDTEACPTHGHRLIPGRIGDRWWLSCPTRSCKDGRWME